LIKDSLTASVSKACLWIYQVHVNLLTLKKLLPISGEKKKMIAHNFLSKKISTNLPASLLWLQPETTCIIQSVLAPY
jgi:hypothetical protein